MTSTNPGSAPILVLLALSACFLTGCATGDKESILPQDGPTMMEVYRTHFTRTPLYQADNTDSNETQWSKRNASGNAIKRLRHDPDELDADLSDYTRGTLNEIRQLFPRLRNNTLILYVYPHLSKNERYPVPGYSTAFTFYEKTEFALPGELEEGY